MLMLLEYGVFGGAAAASGYAMWTTIATNGEKIMKALTGQPLPRFAPLATLARAERRIAVRRWAGSPAPMRVRVREAA